MSWEDFNMWLYGAVSALVGGIIFLIRKIVTNEKKIALMEQKWELNEQYRREQDAKLQTQLTEIRTDIKTLMKVKE